MTGIIEPAVRRPLDRRDGKAKTTGAALFAAEFSYPEIAHAALVHSTCMAAALRTGCGTVESRSAAVAPCRRACPVGVDVADPPSTLTHIDGAAVDTDEFDAPTGWGNSDVGPGYAS